MAKSIRIWNVGKGVSYLQIEIFEGNYDKSKFYPYMGIYFAEQKCKKRNAIPHKQRRQCLVTSLSIHMLKKPTGRKAFGKSLMKVDSNMLLK